MPLYQFSPNLDTTQTAKSLNKLAPLKFVDPYLSTYNHKGRCYYDIQFQFSFIITLYCSSEADSGQGMSKPPDNPRYWPYQLSYSSYTSFLLKTIFANKNPVARISYMVFNNFQYVELTRQCENEYLPNLDCEK